MACALAADFAALPGVEVVILRDGRWSPISPERGVHEIAVSSMDEEWRAFRELAASSDWTVLIAPETAGILRRRAEWVLAAGGRLLSPDPTFIALTTDKHQTACHLARQGVPVPTGWLVTKEASPPDGAGLSGDGVLGCSDEAAWPWPMVVKPVDGCGSQGVARVQDAAAWKVLRPQIAACGNTWRIERWIEGLAASVGVLCGPGGRAALPACAQHLAEDGFAYQGGRTPLAAPLDARARQLALDALGALPPTCGYVGVDLVLGADETGCDDHVIEVNPRLTTSYLGLRRALRDNLAGAMLRLASGQPWAWSSAPVDVQFTAEGQLTLAAGALPT